MFQWLSMKHVGRYSDSKEIDNSLVSPRIITSQSSFIIHCAEQLRKIIITKLCTVFAFLSLFDVHYFSCWYGKIFLLFQGHIAALSYSDGAIKVYDTISGRQIMIFHARCSAEHLRFLNKELIICSYADRWVSHFFHSDIHLSVCMESLWHDR